MYINALPLSKIEIMKFNFKLIIDEKVQWSIQLSWRIELY